MKYAQNFTNIANRLRARGFTVTEVDGWQSRGHGDFVNVQGAVLHHTVDNGPADYPSLKVVTNGRADLAGPLCNWGVGRAGTLVLVAAGVAWHAGATLRADQTNSHTIGIEAANNGTTEPWGEPLLRAYVALCEEIQREFDVPTPHFEGHKEVCAPHGRKIDPDFDVAAFRSRIGQNLGPVGSAGGGVATTISVVPAAYITTTPNPITQSGSGTIVAQGDEGEGVREIQHALNRLGFNVGAEDGEFGKNTDTGLRAFQAAAGIGVDGVAGPATRSALAKVPDYKGLSTTKGEPCRAFQQRLKDRGWKISVDGVPGAETTKVIKSFQAEKGLGADGVGGPATWVALFTRGL